METTALIHVWNRCHGCKMQPIVGVRHSCQTCPAGPDNDLCPACYGKFLAGELAHPAPDSFAQAARLGAHVFKSHLGRPAVEHAHFLAGEHPALPAPPLPEGFVVRPEFRSGVESFLGSYGFVVEVEGWPRPLVLSALHLLDEALKRHGIDAESDTESDAGNNTGGGYTGRELPALISGVQLYDPFAERWFLAELGSAGRMLVLPDARTGQEEPFSDRDIAAFELADGERLRPGRLAEQPPAVGEPIWLAARPKTGPARRLLQALVVEQDERTLIFRFQDPQLEAPYASGAPLIDRTGRVVGINSGGGWLAGQRLGHACHVGAICRHLATSALSSGSGAP